MEDEEDKDLDKTVTEQGSETLQKANEYFKFRRMLDVSRNFSVEIKLVPRFDVSIEDPNANYYNMDATNKALKQVLEMREKILDHIVETKTQNSDVIEILKNYNRNILEIIGIF